MSVNQFGQETTWGSVCFNLVHLRGSELNEAFKLKAYVCLALLIHDMKSTFIQFINLETSVVNRSD